MARSDLETRAQRRRAVVVALLGVMFLSFAILTLAGWLFLHRMGTYLEEDRKRQLTAIASLGARILEARFYPVVEGLQDDFSRSLMRGALLRMHIEGGLQAVYLIDRELRVVLSSQPELMEGEPLSYLLQDTAAIRRAFSGFPSASALHVVGNSRFLTAYAPVGLREEGPDFALAAEASADFFAILASFRRGLILGGLAGVGILVLFGIALGWGVRRLVVIEEALRRQERLATIGQMAASLAHEIRNPLGIIKNTAQILQRRYGQNQHDPLFDFIPEEVERLNGLVTDYLTLSREPKLQPEAIEIGRFLERLWQSESDPKRRPRFAVHDPEAKILCDRGALERILLNLVRNAREACGEEGEVLISTAPATRHKRPYVRISVADSGPGLPSDVPAERLFEPFFTTKKAGTGLGLAVTKVLAEASGGWIEARNREGGGAEVSVYLPAA